MTAHINHTHRRQMSLRPGQMERASGKSTLGVTKAAFLGALIALGFGVCAKAEPVAGTYVTPGMGVVLHLEDCDDTMCAEISKGQASVRSSAKSLVMMPPHQGAGWRYMQMHDNAGQHAGWLREDDNGTLQVLSCVGLKCQRMSWMPLGIMKDDMRNIGSLMNVATF